VLAVAAVAGYVLGACGGGDGGALTTGTRLTGTRTVLTGTGVAPTQPTQTVVTTVTTAETTEVTTTAEQVSPTPPPPAVTETQTSSTSSRAWGWIALGIGVAAALLIGILIWRRNRARTASWSSQMADLNRRCLVALDDVLANGSVVTGHVQALAAEAQSLEERAPDDLSRTAAARLHARLDDLAGTLEADRTLRLASPPPSREQISYSTALIRQQADQLQGVLRPPRPGESPA
jgi:hypothetical protein